LSRTPEDRKKLFVLEQQFIAMNEKRLRFVSQVINQATNNSLVLFHHVDHGKKLYNEILNLRRGAVYYVDGGTSPDDRELYKGRMEEGTGKILVASFGTFSTGINITNLHNVFLTESFKSEIIIRQSIGRGLRMHEFKDKLVIIDFVDDIRLTLGNGRIWENYLFKHARSRLQIYQEQKFPYTIKRVTF
jgi:superfamily II DNA or RNA helicase